MLCGDFFDELIDQVIVNDAIMDVANDIKSVDATKDKKIQVDAL